MGSSDVTAVLLTIGEPYVARARASLAAQTAPPAAIVEIAGVAPFHRALNAGIARVRTAYFVQVDADVVLDPNALADLRACMTPHVGLVIGRLRDPLRGRIEAVKLYRTEAAAAQPCPDSISPAVELLSSMTARGWLTLHALADGPGPPALRHTFGDHLPDYTPLYTFTKFRILGARHRHWRTGHRLRRLCAILHASGHPAAAIAQAAAAVGVFWEESRDALRPCTPSDEFARIAALLDGPLSATPLPVLPDARQAFVDHHRLGAALARANDAGGFRGRFAALAGTPDFVAWVALVGLCRGGVAPADEAIHGARDFERLAALFPDGLS